MPLNEWSLNLFIVVILIHYITFLHVQYRLAVFFNEFDKFHRIWSLICFPSYASFMEIPEIFLVYP